MGNKRLLMLPGPTNVPDRIMDAMSRPIINHRGPEFHELQDSITENLRYVFQTENDVFVISSSGTGGVECAIGNVVAPKDKVIIPVNGVFSQRIKEKIQVFGGIPLEIPVEWGKAVTPEQVKSVIEREKNVKAIAVTYNDTSTGVTVRDLSIIGEIAKQFDSLFIVDAISILGGDHLPVDKWNIDICIAGSQKCLACPPGLVMVSVSEKAWKSIVETPPNYYFNLIKHKEFQERKETPFTPAIPLFFALDEALKMIKEEGLEKRIKRHGTCARALYGGIKEMALELFADERWRSNTVIAVKNPLNLTDEKIRKLLREKYGVVIAGGMGKLKGTMFRIGSMGAVTRDDILTTLVSLEKTLSELGYEVKEGAGAEAAEEIFTKFS